MFTTECIAKLTAFQQKAGRLASATIFRIGLGLLGGKERTVPFGELSALTGALREEEWGDLLVTDRANHVLGWRKGRASTLNTGLADRWREFWDVIVDRRSPQLLWTQSHRDSTLAGDLLRGRSPELYLGNAFADCAAGARG